MLYGYHSTPPQKPTKTQELREMADELRELLTKSDKFSREFCNQINQVIIYLDNAREILEELTRVVYVKE